MKPNFALSLLFDRVELLHRTDSGWKSVGIVLFDADDLTGALSDLRKTALGLDPAGLRSKIILPDEQIKFITLKGKTADEAAVRAALEGATPYGIDELAYDFSCDSKGTHIAAVARETLDEAEAFALEHKFAPISIVAKLKKGRFDGEPFFGQTNVAAELLGPKEIVERDDTPSKSNDAVKTPKSTSKKTADKATVKADAVEKPKPEAKASKDTDTNESKTTPPPPDKSDILAQAKNKALAQSATNHKEKPAKNTSGEGKTSSEEDETPVFSSRHRNTKPIVDPIGSAIDASKGSAAKVSIVVPESQKPAAVTPTMPAPTVPQPVPPRATPGTPPSAVSDRLARIARTNLDGPSDIDFRSNREPIVRPQPIASRDVPPMSRPTPPTKSEAVAPKAIAASLAPSGAPRAPHSGGLFASRRKQPGPDLTNGKAADTAAAPNAATATRQDRSKMTTFDQQRKPRGKSRFLWLILTALLLLFMAAVAAWATLSPDSGLMVWLRGTIEDPDPILVSAPSDATPITTPMQPEVTQVAPQLILPSTSAPVIETPAEPELLASVAQSTDAALDPDVTANPIPAPVEVVSAQQDPIITPATARGTVVSPAEAERIYASTGVWLRAPRMPLRPTGELLDPVAPLRTDPETSARTVIALPERGTVLPDAVLSTQLNPPAADVVFPRDDRGLLLATAQGTRSPYGMLIYTGQPAVVPPARPGTQAPEPVVIAQEETPTQTATPDTDVAQAETEETAPETSTEPSEETTPDQTDTEIAAAIAQATQDAIAQLATAPARDDRGFYIGSPEGTPTPEGTIVYAGLPAVVPPSRPATIAPEPEVEIAETTPDVEIVESEPETEFAEAAPDADAIQSEPETEIAGAETVAEPEVEIAANPQEETEIASATDLELASPAQEPASVERDARGFFKASTEGTHTPDGTIVFAGLPTVVPPTRPGTVEAEDAPAEIAEAALDNETLDATEVTPGGVSLASLRPSIRPEVLAPAPRPVLAGFAGSRPVARSANILDGAATPQAVPITPEIDNSTVAATLAAIVSAAPDPLATATAQAVSRTIVPAQRPRNFATVVARAQTRQASVQQTAPAATQVSSAPATPNGPVPQSVAAAATRENAINLHEVNLISVAGRPGQQHALVRLGNGRLVRVEVGDALDGGRVSAIQDSVINYVKRGRTIALGIPG